MLIRTEPRQDFADTTAFAPSASERGFAFLTGRAGPDPIDALAGVDRADRTLLMLVVSATAATLLLALAASLVV